MLMQSFLKFLAKHLWQAATEYGRQRLNEKLTQHTQAEQDNSSTTQTRSEGRRPSTTHTQSEGRRPSTTHTQSEGRRPSTTHTQSEGRRPSATQLPPAGRRPSATQLPPAERRPSLTQLPPAGRRPSATQLPPVERRPSLTQLPPAGRKNLPTGPQEKTDKTQLLSAKALGRALEEEKMPKPRAAEKTLKTECTEEMTPLPGERKAHTQGEETSSPSCLLAFLVSLAAAAAPWAFPSENSSHELNDMVMTFAGGFAAILSAVGGLKKISISRRTVFALFVLCAIAFAFFLIPPRTPTWQQTWQPIAIVPAGTWADNQTYLVYADETLDLSNVRSLRLTFDPSQAGTQFRLRLLPLGADAKQPVGVKQEILSIPEDGRVTVSLKPEDFGLTNADMRQLAQIAVVASGNAWVKPDAGMQNADTPHTVFRQVEALARKKNQPSGNRRNRSSGAEKVPSDRDANKGESSSPALESPVSESPASKSSVSESPVSESPASKDSKETKESPPFSETSPKDSLQKQNEKPPQHTAAWQVIADSSKTWTDGKAYVAYVDGRFNLSSADFIRITFEPNQANTKFLLRLVPQKAASGKPIGIRWTAVSIPPSGVVTIPLQAEEFGLTPADMRRLTQMAILSGGKAWNRSLGQDAKKHADFKKIEIWPGNTH